MFQIDDLIYLMQRLRDPQSGCPWDLKQDYRSIVPHTLEEAYEVADAIERGDKADLRDELGDLLFQVIFYSQLGSEEGEFEFADVVNNVVEKLVRRHPHVFYDGTLRGNSSDDQRVELSEAEIKANWEKIKAEERSSKKGSGRSTGISGNAQMIASVLDTVPNNFPSLPRAEKLQKKASQVGFDWQDITQVFDKIQEELDEVKEVLELSASGALDQIQAKLEHEMGDVLFACVNLARFLKVNADKSLRGTNQRFVNRFQHVEKQVTKMGKDMKKMSETELDELWEAAKRLEQS